MPYRPPEKILDDDSRAVIPDLIRNLCYCQKTQILTFVRMTATISAKNQRALKCAIPFCCGVADSCPAPNGAVVSPHQKQFNNLTV